MTKDILLTIFITSTLLFSTLYFIISYKMKKVLNDLSKLFIDKTIMEEYIKFLQHEEPISGQDNLIDKENFIKFLSDSRDWAFTYIEDVQNGLKEFIDSVDSDLKYFDEYGEVGSAYPHYDSMVRINNAYKKIKELMPKEEETK